MGVRVITTPFAGKYDRYLETQKRGLPWTDQRVERLKKLWAGGDTAGEIAKRLGGTTRNAVLGKLHRLGLLKGRAQSNGQLARKQAQSRPKESRPKRLTFGASPTPRQKRAPEVPQHPTPPVLTPHPENMPRVSLFETGTSKCKYPLWEDGDDHRDCCGLPTEGLGPYCTHHRRVTYHPIETRKKQRRAA